MVGPAHYLRVQIREDPPTPAMNGTAAPSTASDEASQQDAPPISYPAAALRERPHRDAARRALDCLSGPEAAAVFARFGFTLPPRPAAAGEGARGTP